jgi:hypothetical protein
MVNSHKTFLLVQFILNLSAWCQIIFYPSLCCTFSFKLLIALTQYLINPTKQIKVNQPKYSFDIFTDSSYKTSWGAHAAATSQSQGNNQKPTNKLIFMFFKPQII